MDIITQIQQVIQGLQNELNRAAPDIDGTVSRGTVEPLAGYCANLQVRFPELKGIHNTWPVWISFSINLDFSQLLAGQPTSKSTPMLQDYLHPWLQIYLYRTCPFVLFITPERTDFMTRITRAIGLESRGLQLGMLDFDTRYLLDCRANPEKAEAFLRTRNIPRKIQSLDALHLLRFESTYIKLVTSLDPPKITAPNTC